MLNWLRRRRLSRDARRKMLILAARAEEALVETHVANALELLDTLAAEVDLGRGIELYMEMMSVPEPLSATITNRILARLDAAASEDGRYQGVFAAEPRRVSRRR